MASNRVNYNDTLPPPPVGRVNIKWQADATVDPADVSAHVSLGDELVNAQTGTSYVVLDADRAHLITFSSASAVAVSLPETFLPGWFADFSNLGTGTVTITAATSPLTCLINGAAALVLAPGQRARLCFDGVDYQLANHDLALAKYTTSWTAQTSVTVTHGLGTTAVIVQVFDASGILVIPESVTITSSSVVTLTFGAAFTGSVVVIG